MADYAQWREAGPSPYIGWGFEFRARRREGTLVEFRLFGPVELWAEERRIDLGPSKTRLLLAALLMEAGGTVPFATLVRRVWDEQVPEKVSISVHSSVSRLRRCLEQAGQGGACLEHVSPVGYRLLVPTGNVDALEFTRLVIQGQAAGAGGNHQRAIELLRSAEKLVRGEPLAGLPGAWAQATRAGLIERRHAAALTRLRLQLDCDDPRELIAELRELAGGHPLDEDIAGLLIRALHAAGRTGDALDLYAATRHRLRTQLGIDPHRPLNEIHQQVLRGDGDGAPRTTASLRAPEARPIQDSLERDPPTFVGRQEDLAGLRRQITGLVQQDQPVLCVIDGMAGIGKTTLAVRLAHLLRAQCPDGALQVHLRGHDASQPPATAYAALSLLLTMVQADTRELQHTVGMDHAIALWRRHTRGRRLIIVLDDALDEQQIQPLIPSGPGSVVLVTSRHRLADAPDAIHHTLPLMRKDEARTLFTNTAKLDVHADPGTVEQVVRACGRLPLALSVAGGFLRARPSWSVADFADHLARALASDGSDSLSKRLDATFETSYRDLPALPRRVLRRLALHPSTRITLHAAAALADASLPEADAALDLLVEHHLLAEPQRHRYRMHDLMRGFAARALARDEQPEEQHAADDRLVRYTLGSVERATKLFHPHRHANLLGEHVDPPDVETLTFPDAHGAAAWLDEEQSALRARAEHWHTTGRTREAAALSHMLAMYFDRRGLWRESAPLYENSLHTWVRLGNTLGQAHTLGDLATVRWRLGALDQARFCSETALTLWRALGDIDGQAEALLHLGRAHHYAHEHAPAISCYRQSATLRSMRGDTLGNAESLYHLGVVLFDSGQYDEGIADTRDALDLARSLHDPTIERNCINNLGEFHRQRGEYGQALECYRQAATLAERVGDPRNIAVAMLNVGEISNLMHLPDEALAPLEAALGIFTRLGTRHSIVNTLLAQLRAYEQLGRYEQATSALESAAAIAEQLADSRLSADVYLASGALHEHREDYTAALAAYRNALSHALTAHAILNQAAAYRGIGNVLARGPRPVLARAHWRKALELYDPLHAQEAVELHDKLDRVPARQPRAKPPQDAG